MTRDLKFKKLYIRNFLSIKELEIEFEESGCYHIKGDNNIGKSNFLKAIRTLVENVTSRKVPKYLRDNEDTFYIESVDFDGNVVRLSRGAEDYYSWDINGVSGRVDKTAGKVPDTIVNYFNFYVNADPTGKKKLETVNIRHPRARLLFVDTTDGENYLFLQKAMGTGEYLGALKKGNSRKGDMKKEITSLVDRLEEESVVLNGIKDYGGFLSDVSIYEGTADAYIGQIELAEECVTLAREISEREVRLSDATYGYDAKYVGDLASELRELDELLSVWRVVEETERRVAERATVIEAFKEARDVAKELSDVLATREELDLVSRMTRDVEKRASRLDEVADVLSSYDVAAMKELAMNVQLGSIAVNEGKQLREALGKASESKGAYESAVKVRDAYLAEIGMCPVCGNDTSECHSAV